MRKKVVPSSEKEVGDKAAADAALLRGNVPSAEEWRDAWAMLSETSSLRKCARVRRKQKLSTDDPAEEGRLRKCRRKQLLCLMAEVLRVEEAREVLRNATSIAISLDESKKYRKVVRYRADAPVPAVVGGVAQNRGASGYCRSLWRARHPPLLRRRGGPRGGVRGRPRRDGRQAAQEFSHEVLRGPGGDEGKHCLWRVMRR